MKISVSLSSFAETKWYEFVLRFVLGGFVTAVVGLVGTKFGPIIGGLFLAFPSIFPAAVTLVEKHEAEKKEKDGKGGKDQARCAAGADAAGAAMGSFGLLTFGFIVWRGASSYTPLTVLTLALCAWLAVSIGIWLVRKHL